MPATAAMAGWTQANYSPGRHLAVQRTSQDTAFQLMLGSSFVCKTATTAPLKKPSFEKMFLNSAEKNLLIDHCHPEDGQKSSAPAWSNWHINVRFDDIVYLYFKIVNIYMVVNSAIKGNWKHGAAHLTALTQDANYRFSEDDSGKQSINVLKNECHSW